MAGYARRGESNFIECPNLVIWSSQCEYRGFWSSWQDKINEFFPLFYQIFGTAPVVWTNEYKFIVISLHNCAIKFD